MSAYDLIMICGLVLGGLSALFIVKSSRLSKNEKDALKYRYDKDNDTIAKTKKYLDEKGDKQGLY